MILGPRVRTWPRRSAGTRNRAATIAGWVARRKSVRRWRRVPRRNRKVSLAMQSKETRNRQR